MPFLAQFPKQYLDYFMAMEHKGRMMDSTQILSHAASFWAILK